MTATSQRMKSQTNKMILIVLRYFLCVCGHAGNVFVVVRVATVAG